ncbi:MAG: hypothetical protein ACI8ZM_000537 [Crocinitomix sp.]|jgi:hypothetical protein
MNLKSKFQKKHGKQSQTTKEKINFISFKDFQEAQTKTQQENNFAQLEEIKRAEETGESLVPIFYEDDSPYIIVRVESLDHINLLQKTLKGLTLVLKPEKRSNSSVYAIQKFVFVLDEFYFGL